MSLLKEASFYKQVRLCPEVFRFKVSSSSFLKREYVFFIMCIYQHFPRGNINDISIAEVMFP